MPQSFGYQLVSAEITPKPGARDRAVALLRDLGFRIIQVGQTIYLEGTAERWERYFFVAFENYCLTEKAGDIVDAVGIREIPGTLAISGSFSDVIADVDFLESIQDL